ncbi:MAG: M20 family metallopeptidase [Promethearchaeota archaeon]
MNEVEKKILNRIDETRDEIINFHQEIVRIPSENPPRKYKEIARFTCDAFNSLGLKTMIKRDNVIGEISGGEGPALIFYGHLDTVEAFSGWTKDPFGGELIEGKIYGRGASDDKFSVIAEIFATRALLEEKLKFNGKLILTAVIDEEMGDIKEHIIY